MKSFDLRYQETRIHFGDRSVEKLKGYIQKMNHVILVTGKNSARLSGAMDDVEKLLKEEDVDLKVYDNIRPNPTTEIADDLADLLREEKPDCVIAIGGGSVIDTAKVASVIAIGGGCAEDYLRGRKIGGYLPLFVVNLTHGTGSEVDRYAVLTSGKIKMGISARYPTASFDDPRYMLSLPVKQSIYTSIDAFFHAYEALTSRHSNPFVRTLSLDSAEIIGENLPKNQDIEAKRNLLYASMIAGISLDMSPAHVVHAIEHALSGINPDLPHGCGLAMVGARSIYWIHRHSEASKEIIQKLTRERIDDAKSAEDIFKRFLEEIGFEERLSDYGFGRDDFREVEKIVFEDLRYLLRRAPFNLTRDMLIDILENSL